LEAVIVSNLEIRRLTADDPRKGAVVLMLAEVFERSPVFEYAFPTIASRGVALRALFNGVVDDVVRFGCADIALADEVVGALLWYPPGRYPMQVTRALSGLPSYLSVAARNPFGLLKLFRIQQTLDRFRPAQPHCHGCFLAGRPGARVSYLLGRRMLDEADANAWPAYLETQDSRTVALYLRFGFEVVESRIMTSPGAPATWTMWRHPRPALGRSPPSPDPSTSAQG
jgi:hypothetical protein